MLPSLPARKRLRFLAGVRHSPPVLLPLGFLLLQPGPTRVPESVEVSDHDLRDG
jgi:hypothetical protein